MDLLVNLDVDDLDKAIRFYSTAFDLAVGRRLVAPMSAIGHQSTWTSLSKI